MIRRSLSPPFCTALGIVEYANGATSTSPVASAVIMKGAAAKWIGSTVYVTPTCLAMPGFTNRMGDNSEGTTAQARRILSGSADSAWGPIIATMGSTSCNVRRNIESLRYSYVPDEHFISLAPWQGDQAKPQDCL